jgi:lipopolysaccharide/colanic/teichoic acid biosynthesis glycosyltransferase
VKRLLDVLLSLFGLAALTPVFLLVALAIKLDSPGPVFFRQLRVGRGGLPFRIFKFRTMVRDAEKLGVNVSAHDDPRVTRVGRWLRKSFLDEAPQLLNVLLGHMSLVGPRPETPEHAARFTPHERRMLELRPGMAGPSTLEFSRTEAKLLGRQHDPERYYTERLLHERAQADLSYLERSSLLGDLRILARTAAFVVAGALRREH